MSDESKIRFTNLKNETVYIINANKIGHILIIIHKLTTMTNGCARQITLAIFLFAY